MKYLGMLFLFCLAAQAGSQPLAGQVEFALRYPGGEDGYDDLRFKKAQASLRKNLTTPYDWYEMTGGQWVPGQVFQIVPGKSNMPKYWFYVFGKDVQGNPVIRYPAVAPQEGATAAQPAVLPGAHRGFRLAGEGLHQVCVLISAQPLDDWDAIAQAFKKPGRNFQKRVRKSLAGRLLPPEDIQCSANGLSVNFEPGSKIIPVFLTIRCEKALAER